MNEATYEALVDLLMDRRDAYHRVVGDISSEDLAADIMAAFVVLPRDLEPGTMTARQIIEEDGHGWDD